MNDDCAITYYILIQSNRSILRLIDFLLFSKSACTLHTREWSYFPFIIVICLVFYCLIIDAMPDLCKAKKSELRLYCDLLMQQVHSVKEIASAKDTPVDIEVSMS